MHPDARDLADRLGLAAHPEGGFFREMFRATATVSAHGGVRAASTAIYYLLPAGSFSALHRVRSDEVWHHYDGDPVDLHAIDPAGAHVVTRLGRDFAAGQRPQQVVRGDWWQAAVPVGERYALCGCTVAPGFDFADFSLPSRDELVARFPTHAGLIEQLTRS